MTTQDVERRITDVLRKRSQAAMSATHIEDDLDLLRRRATRDRRWRQALGAAAALAAVAASAALLIPRQDLGDSGGGPAPSAGTGADSVVVEVFAGSLTQGGAADGQGAEARFSYLSGIAVDPSGTVYVTDADSPPGSPGGPTPGSRTRIRAITPDGRVTTLVDRADPVEAGPVPFTALAVDPAGRLFVQQGASISRVSRDGQVIRVGGNPNYTDGPCEVATVRETSCMITDVAAGAGGTLYVAAGDGAENGAKGVGTFSSDGTVTDLDVCADCRDFVAGVAVDDSGRVSFIADDRVRRVTPNGQVTVLADLDPDWGDLVRPKGIAVKPDGSEIYATGWAGDNLRLYRVTPDGVVSRIDHPLINVEIRPNKASYNDGDVAVGPDGAVYLIKNGTTILKITGA